MHDILFASRLLIIIFIFQMITKLRKGEVIEEEGDDED